MRLRVISRQPPLLRESMSLVVLATRHQGYSDPSAYQQRISLQQQERARNQQRQESTGARFKVERVNAEANPEGAFVGIDLGTTNSCVSYIDPETGRPKIIPSPSGSWVLPTAITFDKQHSVRLFGEEARSVLKSSASSTLCSGKRLIGRRYGDVGRVRDQLSKTNNISIGTRGDVEVEVAGRSYSVVHVTGMFLRYVKTVAESYLGKTVDSAVVSVPAYFSPQQKVATEDAALIAGFEVMEVIDEPSAACLAFTVLSGAHAKERDANVGAAVESSLVFDLGGGTLDCALMDNDRRKGSFQLVATHGDPLLGGNDWDNLLAIEIASQFRAKWKIDLTSHNIGPEMQNQNNRALLIEAEKCKVHFTSSVEPYYGFNRNFYFCRLRRELLPLEVNLTLTQYLEITKPLRDRCLLTVERLLTNAHRSPADIQNVLLVGAMTRDPPIRMALSKFFGRPVAANEDCPADYAVAIGAAVRGGMLRGQFKELMNQTSFVSGTVQAEQEAGLLSKVAGTARALMSKVAGSKSIDNPNAIGHKWRGLVAGLPSEEIEKFAKEIVEFEATTSRQKMLEKVERDSNNVISRAAKVSGHRQAMNDKEMRRLTDQVKFWQYMVRNFHDHEEQLQTACAGLTKHLDQLDGLDADSTLVTPEGTIDFDAVQRNQSMNVKEGEDRSAIPGELAKYAATSTPDPNSQLPSDPRSFTDPRVGAYENAENQAAASLTHPSDATRKSSRRKIFRRDVPLPKSRDAGDLPDAAAIIDKGTHHMAKDKNEFDLSERTRKEIFADYVEERAWREPQAPPGEHGSWKEVQTAIKQGQGVGSPVTADRVSLMTPLSERLAELHRSFPYVAADKDDANTMYGTVTAVGCSNVAQQSL